MPISPSNSSPEKVNLKYWSCSVGSHKVRNKLHTCILIALQGGRGYEGTRWKFEVLDFLKGIEAGLFVLGETGEQRGP